MQNANLSQEGSEEQGSSIPDTPHPSAAPGCASASTIERAAERLDWTIAFGMRRDTQAGHEATTKQQVRPDPLRMARAPWLRSGRAAGLRLRLSLCLASVLVAAAGGAGIFLLTHTAREKATVESEADDPAKARGAGSLIRGLAMLHPASGTTQSAELAAPAPAASEPEEKLSLATPTSPPGGPKPTAPTTPAAKTLEATPTLPSPAARNQSAVLTFSAAEIAALLARGDWLFATGEVASARLLYERAADAGEARAAVRLGETFDPAYLHYSHLRSLRGNPGMAVFWYRRARDLGATGVASRLERLEAKEERN